MSCRAIALAALVFCAIAGATVLEMPASAVLGAQVVDGSGSRMGTIADVVFHSQTGTVRYVAIRHDGVPGIGEDLAAISDWQLLPAAPGRFVANVARESLERLPAFQRVRWPAMRASDLLGREVLDRRRRDAGEIVDLLVDFGSGRVSHAILELRDDLVPGSLRVSVPIESFSLPRDLGDRAVLNVEREALGLR